MANLLPGGVLPPGEPTIDLASYTPEPAVKQLDSAGAAFPVLKRIDPDAKAKLAAQAPDPFEGLEEAPSDAFAGLEEVTSDAFSGLSEADDLDLKDEKALVEDDTFNPAEYFAANPETDVAKTKKLLNVYRARRVRGLEAGKVAEAAVKEAPGIVKKTVRGVRDLASRAIELGVQPAANKFLGFVTGTTSEQQSLLEAEQGKEQLKAASEVVAGTETAVTGIAQLGQQGVRKVFGKSPEKATDGELFADLELDAEFSKTMRRLSQGDGDTSKLTGLDAETLEKNGIVLDKEAIERLSLVDPITLVGTAGAFKLVGVAGKLLGTATTKVGGQLVIDGLKKAAAKSVQLAGKGVAATSKVAKATAEILPARSIGAIAGGLKTGTLTGAAVGAATGDAVKRVLVGSAEQASRGGTALAELGEQLAPGFTGPKTAGLQRLSNIAASPVGQITGGAVSGAAQGVATAVPLALATDDSQTAGALIGGGAALGGITGGVVRAKKVAVESIAKNYLDPSQISFQDTASPAYGNDTGLDIGHEAAIKTLTLNERNMVNTFREAIRPAGGEIYVQDQNAYLKSIEREVQKTNGGNPLTPEEQAQVALYAKTHAFFDGTSFDAQGNQRRVVFLNGSAKGLPHDSGHLFQSLLAPDHQQSLRDSVFKNYTPEQLASFAEEYSAKIGEADYFTRLGDEAGKAKVADEIIAENFGQLFRNTPLADLRAPSGFLQDLGQTAVGAAEALGIDLTAGRVTPDLQVKPSYRLQGILRNAAQEILSREGNTLPPPKEPTFKPILPDEVKPAEVSSAPIDPPVLAAERPLSMAAGELPVPEAVKFDEVNVFDDAELVPMAPSRRGAVPSTAKNIRVTREAQADFASVRADETGIAEAQKATESNPEVRATVDQISESMQKGNPVLEIEHRGILSERGPGSPEGRTSRRGTQAQGYEALAALQIENRKNAPADIVDLHQKTFVPVRFVTQGGKPTLLAMSLDKVIANITRVVGDTVANGAEALLPYPVEGGKLTKAGWAKAVEDVKAYAENQSNGYRGDGKKLVRPVEDIGISIPAENPSYTPKPLSEPVMNFANLLQGINTKTGRVQKGIIPGNLKGQLIAEVNTKQPLTPSVIEPENVGSKQEFKGYPGRSVKEMNPLRNELAARGVKVRELAEVTERLAVEDIAKVTQRPDIGFKAPVTDTIRAGFLPGDVRELGQYGGEILNMSPEEWRATTDSWDGGLTAQAYRMGLSAPNVDYVAKLLSIREEIGAKFKEVMATGDLDAALPYASKAQLFSESYGAATGNASAKSGLKRLGFDESTVPFPNYVTPKPD